MYFKMQKVWYIQNKHFRWKLRGISLFKHHFTVWFTSDCFSYPITDANIDIKWAWSNLFLKLVFLSVSIPRTHIMNWIAHTYKWMLSYTYPCISSSLFWFLLVNCKYRHTHTFIWQYMGISDMPVGSIKRPETLNQNDAVCARRLSALPSSQQTSKSTQKYFSDHRIKVLLSPELNPWAWAEHKLSFSPSAGTKHSDLDRFTAEKWS